MMRIWTGTIIGQPCSKANSRKMVKIKGKWRSIKSGEALIYEDSAQKQLAGLRARPLIEGPVRVSMRVHYRSGRPDLDESLILDVLQGYVYKNDRQVVWKDIKRGTEKPKDPHVVIEVEQLPFGRFEAP